MTLFHGLLRQIPERKKTQYLYVKHSTEYTHCRAFRVFWLISIWSNNIQDLCSVLTGVRVCGSDNGTLLKFVYLNPQNTLRGKSVSFQPDGSDFTLHQLANTHWLS